MSFAAPAGLFLDFYGTVTAGDRAWVEAICQQIVDRYDLPTTAEELAVRWGRFFFSAIESANGPAFHTLLDCERDSLAETLAEFGLNVPADPYAQQLRGYWRRPALQNDVRDALDCIEVPICILSNADHEDLLAGISHIGLNFDDVISSEQARHYKPHSAIFEFALRRTGWPADGVLHVGDSLHSDIGGAKGAGLRAVWLRRPGRISDLPAPGPDYTIEGLRELPTVLSQLAGEGN
jgi:2-haloacid dehalogenase/putative hydrolase of the HAD superfamily